jgi:hypothetical protein
MIESRNQSEVRLLRDGLHLYMSRITRERSLWKLVPQTIGSEQRDSTINRSSFRCAAKHYNRKAEQLFRFYMVKFGYMSWLCCSSLKIYRGQEWLRGRSALALGLIANNQGSVSGRAAEIWGYQEAEL